MPGRRFIEMVERSVDSSKPVVTALISPATEDRYGTKFIPAGWDLDSYRQTGTVMLNHGWNGQEIGMIPIGKNESFTKRENGLEAVTTFDVDAPDPAGQWARFALNMLERELMRGWSHMFDPLAWTEKDGTTMERALGTYWFDVPGRTYTRQQMLEYGPVFVPANPDAKTLATSRDLRGELVAAGRRGLEVPPLMLAQLDAYIAFADTLQEKISRRLDDDPPMEPEGEAGDMALVESGARYALALAAGLTVSRLRSRIRGGASRPRGG